jgi:hypothetical protein
MSTYENESDSDSVLSTKSVDRFYKYKKHSLYGRRSRSRRRRLRRSKDGSGSRKNAPKSAAYSRSRSPSKSHEIVESRTAAKLIDSLER